MTRSQAWLAPGLALTTFATLLVEILSTRLLSVLTWYHLSFLAVSLAMLGMASGAVFVFLRGERARGEGALRLLVRSTLAMAVAIPVAHLCSLVIPIPPLTEARLSLDPPAGRLHRPAGRALLFLRHRGHRRADAHARAHRAALRLGSRRRGARMPRRDPAARRHEPHVGDVRRRRGDGARRLVLREGRRQSRTAGAGADTGVVGRRRLERDRQRIPVALPEEPGPVADGRQRGDDRLDDACLRGARPAWRGPGVLLGAGTRRRPLHRHAAVADARRRSRNAGDQVGRTTRITRLGAI